MNKINFNQPGGFPLSTNILDEMQSSYNIFNELGHIAGNGSIISGCLMLRNTITDGVIMLNGELLPFKGGLFAPGSTVVIIEDVLSKDFEDASNKSVVFKRYATVGSTGDIFVTSLKRNLNISSLTDVVNNLSDRLFNIENKQTPEIILSGRETITNRLENGEFEVKFPTPFKIEDFEKCKIIYTLFRQNNYTGFGEKPAQLKHMMNSFMPSGFRVGYSGFVSLNDGPYINLDWMVVKM